jgi:hypothetical protein
MDGEMEPYIPKDNAAAQHETYAPDGVNDRVSMYCHTFFEPVWRRLFDFSHQKYHFIDVCRSYYILKID